MTGGAIYTCTVLTVTAHTEPHFHGRYLLDHRHLRNLPVAVLTTDSGLHVALMVKARMLGKIVDMNPGYRLLVFIILSELLDLGFVGQHRLMAAHAKLDGWQRRIWRFSNAGVAVLTLHLILLHVGRMAKVDRLLRTKAAPVAILHQKVEKHDVGEYRLSLAPKPRFIPITGLDRRLLTNCNGILRSRLSKTAIGTGCYRAC